MIRRIVGILLGFAIFFLAAVLTLGWLLSRPVQSSVGAPPSELNAEIVSFASSSETTVRGWWCPVSPSHGSILLLPGVRANRLSMVDRARFLRRAGYSVLLIDLRSTGETIGRHITFGWDERNDVLAAVDFIRRRNPDDKIGIIGSSLGGAAALFATPPLQIHGLVIEAVYPTIEHATTNRLNKYAGPCGPLVSRLLLAQLKPRLGISESELRPIDHVSSLRCRLFVIAGARDPNTTIEDSNLLFHAAHESKELWIINDAGHVDFYQFARSDYEAKILEFFARAFATQLLAE